MGKEPKGHPPEKVVRWLKERQGEAHRIARQAADADPSDPFTYARTYSHLMNGIGEAYARNPKTGE